VQDQFTRRELGALMAAALAASKLEAQKPAPPLDIAEWSYRWYGVEHALLARGTVCNGMQMYVEHWIPAQVRHPYPVVLIHGGFGQGSDWFTTPEALRCSHKMFH
jgi:pimeloyl-ACP methyl ester carboxylesterase